MRTQRPLVALLAVAGATAHFSSPGEINRELLIPATSFFPDSSG